jgi:hypothetical protein
MKNAIPQICNYAKASKNKKGDICIELGYYNPKPSEYDVPIQPIAKVVLDNRTTFDILKRQMDELEQTINQQ